MDSEKGGSLPRLKLSAWPFRNHKGSISIRIKVCGMENIVLCKWAEGIHDAEYFDGHGKTFEGNKFYVGGAGSYTVYVKDSNGSAVVSDITIKHALPFLVVPIWALLMTGFVGVLVVVNAKNPVPPSGGTSSVSSRPSSSVPATVAGAIDGPAGSGTASVKPQPTVTDKINASAQFPSGKEGTQGSWTFENAKSNKYIMQAKIYLDGQLIATSAALSPGQHADSVQLSRSVAKGSHSATALIDYFDLTTRNYVSCAGYRIGINVAG